MFTLSTITERKKDGKVVAFKFLACLGRDENGKQIFRGTTWKPPKGLSYAKARKLAEAEAFRWEQELRNNGEVPVGEFRRPSMLDEPEEPTIREEETFRYFAERIWLPLKCVAGGLRPCTISMYQFTLRVILPYLGDLRLTEITSVDIMCYLQYLRDDYVAPNGKKVSEKTVRHHFNIIRIIFNYAEKQEFITKNPIKKVDVPRLNKRPVDALTQEQAHIFFRELKKAQPDYRCMMLLMATTGVRRGECLGLQWQDFDFEENTLRIERNVTYTKMSGTVVAEPKTPCSLRTVPLMEGVKQYVLAMRMRAQQRHPGMILTSAYIFEGKDSPFEPRDPNTVTRKVTAFMRSIG